MKSTTAGETNSPGASRRPRVAIPRTGEVRDLVEGRVRRGRECLRGADEQRHEVDDRVDAGRRADLGEIQWMRRNGFAEARNPILKPLDTIECRDAIFPIESSTVRSGWSNPSSRSSIRSSRPCDLLAVRVVRPELRALARVEATLEQRPEDRRVDLRPVEVRHRQHRLDVGPLQRQRRAVVEQTAVEPRHRLEADPPARRHHLEELAGELREPPRSRTRMLQHPREHVPRQQADVVGEHAEDEPVDEMRHRLRVVAALSQRLRHRRERRRRALRERLPRPQPLGVRERPLSAGPASPRRPGPRARTRASG